MKNCVFGMYNIFYMTVLIKLELCFHSNIPTLLIQLIEKYYLRYSLYKRLEKSKFVNFSKTTYDIIS